MAIVSVSSRGQITIPAPIRRMLGIESGTALRLEIRGEEIILKPIKSIKDVAGIFHDAVRGEPEDLDTVRQKMMDAVARDVMSKDKR